MKHVLPEDEDARLRVLFAAAAEPVIDLGFSERVLARVERDSKRRHAVLGFATLAGVIVAADPLWRLARVAGEAVVVNPDRFLLPGAWFSDPLVWVAAAIALLAVPALRWLEE